MATEVNGTHLALEMERQTRYAVHAGSDADMDSVGEGLFSNANCIGTLTISHSSTLYMQATQGSSIPVHLRIICHFITSVST